MIKTKRLILRKYSLNDAPFVYNLLNSKGWLENIGDKKIRTVDDAAIYIRLNYFTSYEMFGYGPFLVSLKNSEEPIGTAGLYKRDGLDHPDIGFAFLPEFWNKGYASEATKAILMFAKNKLKIKQITGITLPNNTPSKKLLKKLGLFEIGTYTNKNGQVLLLFSN